jgi:CheY-like chemotaxis protein
MDMEDALRSMQPGTTLLAPDYRTPLPSPHMSVDISGSSTLCHGVSQPVGSVNALAVDLQLPAHRGIATSASFRSMRVSPPRSVARRIEEAPSAEEHDPSLSGGVASEGAWIPIVSAESHQYAEGGAADVPLMPALGGAPESQALPGGGARLFLPRVRLPNTQPDVTAAYVPPSTAAASLPDAAGGAAAVQHVETFVTAPPLPAQPRAALVALVVDDVAPTRKLVGRVLTRKCGASEVLQAANGREAVDAIGSRLVVLPSGEVQCDVAVVTMDMSMPVMDGVTATRTLREMGFTGVIVGLTGNALQSDVHALREAGADRVCTKPVDAEVLKATIMQLLKAS